MKRRQSICILFEKLTISDYRLFLRDAAQKFSFCSMRVKILHDYRKMGKQCRHRNCQVVKWIDGAQDWSYGEVRGRVCHSYKRKLDGKHICIISLENHPLPHFFQILATVVTTQPDENVPPPISNVVSMGVDFLQSASAVGRIPMNYLRRELQQSDMDILISRMIDRSIRPLVSTLYSSPIKIVCKPLSVDRNVDIRVLGINAAATAMALSSIPLVSNVAACRIAMINNKVSSLNVF